MKLTKEQLKQIIKEELEAVSEATHPWQIQSQQGWDEYMAKYSSHKGVPEPSDEELPQDDEELDQALNPSLPSDIPALQQQIQDLYDSAQGLDPHARYGDGMMGAIQKHLIELEQLIDGLRGEFQ